MITAANYDMVILRGITFGPVTFTLSYAATGLAIDLTGHTAHAVVRKTVTSPIAFDLFPTVSIPAEGVVRIAFTDEQTRLLPLGKFKWDLVIEDPAGARLGPYLAGIIEVKDINTRD